MKHKFYPTRIFFNKALLIFSFLALFQLNSFAQPGGAKYSVNANILSAGDRFGSVNDFPVHNQAIY